MKVSGSTSEQIEQNRRERYKINQEHQIAKAKIRDRQEREVRKLKENHNIRVREELMEQRTDLNRIQNRKQEQVETIRKDLQETKDQLNTEMNRLENFKNRVREDQTQQIQRSYSQRKEEFDNQSQIQEEKFKADALIHKDRRDKELYDLKLDLKDEVSRAVESSRKKINTMNRKNTDIENKLSSDHKSKIDQMRDQHLRKKKKMLVQQSREVAKQTDRYLKAVKGIKETQNKEIASSSQDFNQRVTDLRKNQEKTIQDLELKSNLAKNKIKESLSKEIKHIDTKANDPFYKITTINPKITDKGKHYSIAIPSSPHEARYYRLTGDQRGITVSFNRQFQDKFKNEQAKVKTNRAESMQIDFSVPEIINPKKIERSIEPDQVVFTVYKA